MLFGCILLGLLLLMLIYNHLETNITNASQVEGFYPRRWWWGGRHGTRWAWRQPWMHWWGNWRPYGYYPAYSGYWKQCQSQGISPRGNLQGGSWCPATMSCDSPACQ